MLIEVSVSAQTTRQLGITATNRLTIGRLNQTIELSAEQLKPLGRINYRQIHIKDAAGRELLVQATHNPDRIIFQADFGPGETRTFNLYIGENHLYQADEYKTYGRFVKERFDDFAWENDRIGQRVYGPALKTAVAGSLISSAIDIWPKKINKLIINDWYMTDSYHIDKGEGADLYVSGKSRGVGGDGIWSNNQLWVSENFADSKVEATGPLRVSFDLSYDMFEANGKKIKEEKNITLDAAHNLNHFTVRYQADHATKLQVAAGIQISDLPLEVIRKGLNQYSNRISIERRPGPVVEKETNKEWGWTVMRQYVSVGELYSAVIVNPKNFIRTAQDKDNFLVITELPAGSSFSYWAGYSWSESGQFKNFDEWKIYIDHFAKGILSPIQISVKED